MITVIGEVVTQLVIISCLSQSIAVPMSAESATSWTVIRSSTAGTGSATEVIFVDKLNLRPDFSFEVKVVLSAARDRETCARGHQERLWRRQYVSFCRLLSDTGSDLDCMVRKCKVIRERTGFGRRRSWHDLESEYSDWGKPEKCLIQPMIRGRLDNVAPWLKYAVVEALSCKSEGHGFDYQSGHLHFSLT